MPARIRKRYDGTKSDVLVNGQFYTYKEKMGKGKNFYSKKPKKNWKIAKKGTSVYFLNEVLCDRVLK